MFSIHELKNGINFIKAPIKGTKALTLMALFPVGSRYENKKLSGASHFVEHLMFKGTVKRPTTLEISRSLEAVGAEFNAFTYKDYTGYYVKINSSKKKIAFDLLSDMLFHSKFEAEEVKREKGVIVEELRMYEDNPTMAVDSLFEEVLFGKKHPMGWDIGGTVESVRNLSRDELFAYYEKFYRPDNMVLVAAGNVGDDKSLKKLLNYFEREDGRSKEIKQKELFDGFDRMSWPKDLPLSERVSVKEKKIDQAHLIMGFPGLKKTDKDRVAMSVLAIILGGGMSSRLFIEVRERRGLAYMVNASACGYRDCGSFQIQAGLDPSRLQEAVKVIKNELQKLVSEKVDSKELQDAKSNLTGRLILNAEDGSWQASRLAKQFWFDEKSETFNELFKKIKQVSENDIQRVAKRIFAMKELRAALIAPVSKDKFLTMLK